MTNTNEDLNDHYPFDDLSESKDPAAVLERFHNRDFAKEAFKIERERLENAKEEAQTFANTEDESAAQFDIEYIVNEADREIGKLNDAEPLIDSDIEAAGKAFITARLKRIELVKLLANIKGLDP